MAERKVYSTTEDLQRAILDSILRLRKIRSQVNEPPKSKRTFTPAIYKPTAYDIASGQAEPGGGGEPGYSAGPEVSGPMTSDERASLDKGSLGKQATSALGMDLSGLPGMVASGIVDTVLGAVAPAAGWANTAAKVGTWGAQAIDSALYGPSAMFGPTGLIGPGVRSVNPGPTAAEQQGLADRYGYGMPTGYDTSSPAGLTGGVSMGPGSASTDLGAGFGQAPGDSRDGPSPGNSDTGGTPDSTGGPAGNQGSDVRAKGGVDYATSPRTTRWGEPETGGEEAIYIPETMTAAGVQENEPEVRRALLLTLGRLLK